MYKSDYKNALKKVADRLVALQSPTDFGWDWVVTELTEHSPNPSAPNLYGVTALGLLDAYILTGNTTYLNTAKKVADYLVSLGSNRYHYQFDLEFLVRYAEISGKADYKNFASDVWNWMKSNLDRFADGHQVDLYNYYYERYGNSRGGATWATGDWAIAALVLGDEEWAKSMTDVIKANYTKMEPDPQEYQYVGWGKALKAFHAVDPENYASEIADIVSILEARQQADGHFTGWVQDEAYVIMGLVTVGTAKTLGIAEKAAEWLVEVQGYNSIEGGWILPDGNEYSEVTSEAGQAIYCVASTIVHDVAVSQLVATPTMVEIGGIVEIRVTVKNFGNVYETFNLTTNYGSIAQVEHIVDLEPGGERTFTYHWDTTGESTCFHTISALAHPVEGETYIYNNFRSVGVAIVSFIPEPATLKVEPSPAKGLREFKVNATINDLDAYWDMAGFDIILHYNTTMLDVVNVELGPFALNYNLTFQIIKEVNDEEGYIQMAYVWDFVNVPPEERPTPSGSGVLFTVTFKVTAEGEDQITFANVNLATFSNATKWCTESPIPIKYEVVHGTVKTLFPWKEDVNADGRINIYDLVQAASAYASYPGHPRWNPYADLDGDGRITIYDLVTITRIYGTIYDP